MGVRTRKQLTAYHRLQRERITAIYGTVLASDVCDTTCGDQLLVASPSSASETLSSFSTSSSACARIPAPTRSKACTPQERMCEHMRRVGWRTPCPAGICCKGASLRTHMSTRPRGKSHPGPRSGRGLAGLCAAAAFSAGVSTATTRRCAGKGPERKRTCRGSTVAHRGGADSTRTRARTPFRGPESGRGRSRERGETER